RHCCNTTSLSSPLSLLQSECLPDTQLASSASLPTNPMMLFAAFNPFSLPLSFSIFLSLCLSISLSFCLSLCLSIFPCRTNSGSFSLSLSADASASQSGRSAANARKRFTLQGLSNRRSLPAEPVAKEAEVPRRFSLASSLTSSSSSSSFATRRTKGSSLTLKALPVFNFVLFLSFFLVLTPCVYTVTFTVKVHISTHTITH
ncbi:hypothetical protein LDENG_00241750, partial [Lucifuga dentata]